MFAGPSYDVVVAGCGPVGAVLALQLGRAGLDVLVVDPVSEVFPAPRAVALDDEVLRLLDGLDLDPPLAHQVLAAPSVRFLGAGGRPLLTVDLGVVTPNGQPGLAFFRQPVLEESLRAALSACPSVTVALGCALTSYTASDTGVTVALSDGRAVTAGWLVGADGASSPVRRALGVGWRGPGAVGRWLVVDVAPALPGRGGFTYRCDPARPAVEMPLPGGHRFEWMLLPGETAAVLSVPSLLASAGVDPSSVSVLRAVGYTYAARAAARWRVGRVLLVGDAAHVMPPFAGQGLGAGVRDAVGLAWRLAAVCAGAPVGLLEGWERGRRAHVRRMTALSLVLGGVLETRSPVVARVRDAVLSALGRTPGVGGWLRRGGPRPRSALLPDPLVRRQDGTRVRLDTVLGPRTRSVSAAPGGVLLVGGTGPVVDESGAAHRVVRRRGGRVLVAPDRSVWPG